jgi:hypothetical protein
MNDGQDADSHVERTRIGELLATHGADVARWPADRRPAPGQLEQLLARDVALAEEFARERALDDALQGIDVAAADDLRTHRLQQRILASLPAGQAAPIRDAATAQGDAAAAARTAHASAPAPRRARAAVGSALAALVPLLLGFGAGVSGVDMLRVVTPPAPSAHEQAATLASTETRYADEATMAPFLVAANVDAMTLEWQP